MILRIRGLIFLSIVLWGSILKGQEYSKYSYSIFWNAGQMLAIPSSLSVGVEVRLSKNLFLELEGGPLLYTYNFYNGERDGFKIEPGIKVFLSKHISLAPKFQYKKASQIESTFVSRFDNLYFENTEYNIKREVLGLICDMGVHGQFSESRFGWEFNIGLGIGSIDVQIEGLPEDASIIENNFAAFREEGAYGVPLFRYGFKIKYYLKKIDGAKKEIDL